MGTIAVQTSALGTCVEMKVTFTTTEWIASAQAEERPKSSDEKEQRAVSVCLHSPQTPIVQSSQNMDAVPTGWN